MGDPLWNPPNTGPRFHSSWLTSGEKPRTGTIELGVRDPLDVAYSYNPLIQLGYSSYIYIYIYIVVVVVAVVAV